jgi:hypothetical protein
MHLPDGITPSSPTPPCSSFTPPLPATTSHHCSGLASHHLQPLANRTTDDLRHPQLSSTSHGVHRWLQRHHPATTAGRQDLLALIPIVGAASRSASSSSTSQSLLSLSNTRTHTHTLTKEEDRALPNHSLGDNGVYIVSLPVGTDFH